MALVGSMDLGIGEMVPNAYVRIVNAQYHPNIRVVKTDPKGNQIETLENEWEIEIHIFFSKKSRTLEIAQISAGTLEGDPGWIHNNVMARGLVPLQRFRYATRLVQGLPDPSLSGTKEAVAFFYNWMKSHPIMGYMENMVDDMDTSTDMLDEFKKLIPPAGA